MRQLKPSMKPGAALKTDRTLSQEVPGCDALLGAIKRLEVENAALLEEVRQLRAAVGFYKAVIEHSQADKVA